MGYCHAIRVNSENLPKQEKNRRNAGEGVRQEKWSKTRSLLPKTGGLAGMVSTYVKRVSISNAALVWNSDTHRGCLFFF